jgi:hypothetical protein
MLPYYLSTVSFLRLFMVPNLVVSQHDLIYDMILDESLTIYFASGWRVKRTEAVNGGAQAALWGQSGCQLSLFCSMRGCQQSIYICGRHSSAGLQSQLLQQLLQAVAMPVPP